MANKKKKRKSADESSGSVSGFDPRDESIPDREDSGVLAITMPKDKLAHFQEVAAETYGNNRSAAKLARKMIAHCLDSMGKPW